MVRLVVQRFDELLLVFRPTPPFPPTKSTLTQCGLRVTPRPKMRASDAQLYKGAYDDSQQPFSPIFSVRIIAYVYDNPVNFHSHFIRGHITMKPPSPVLRSLGKNGPLVPRIGFGTMGMGFPCSRLTAPMPDPARLALLDRAYELGCTFWDTSDFYVSCQSQLFDIIQ